MSPASLTAQWLATLSVPLLALVVGFVFLPRPQAVADERKQIDRGTLQGIVSKTRPQLSAPLDIEMEGLRVLGAELPKEPLGKGSLIRSKIYFEVLKPQTRDWTVFIHGDGQGVDYRIHGDHPPAKGRFPTTLWEKGDIVIDEWETRVPLEAPAGTYVIWAGLYQGDDRLRFTGGDPSHHDGHNRVKLGTITVE